MISNLITQPYNIILDPTGGGGRAKPVANGKFYVGEVDKDPVNNPRTDIAYKDESGTERSLTSPLTLNNSGAFVASESDGTIIQPYMKNGLGFSVSIEDKNGNSVYSDSHVGDSRHISDITNIVYKASGGKSAIENMITESNVGDICKIGGSTYERISILSGDIGDFKLISKSNRAQDVGIIYNSEPDAVSNFNYLVYVANQGGCSVTVEDDVYYKVTGSVVTGGICIYTNYGKKSTWEGADAFQLESGSYWVERGGNRVLETGSLKYLSFSSPDNYVPHVQFNDTSWDGDFYHKFDTNNTLNPSVVDFGFGTVIFDGVNIKNRSTNFWTAQSLPYKSFTFVRSNVYNFGANVISVPISNTHPFYNNIKKSMVSMTIRNAEVSNPDEKIGDDPSWAFGSSYHTFILWEGSSLYYHDIEVSNLKTINGNPCYDVYVGGDNFYSDNTTCMDIYGFNRSTKLEENTCLKVKNADVVECDHRIWNYSDTWFTRMQRVHGVTADSSKGEWITYTGSTDAKRFNISNSKFYLPTLTDRDINNRLVQEMDIHNVTFESPGAGRFNLMTVLWDDTNNVSNRKLRFTSNRIYAPSSENTTLVDLVIGNARSGMSITVTDNVIHVKSINEMLISRKGSFDIRTATLVDLNLNNKVTASGVYNKFVGGNRSPAVISMDIGGTAHCNAFSGQGLSLPIMPTGSGSATGRFKQTFRSGSPVVRLFNYLNPSISKISTKYFTYSGKITDVNGVNDFYVNWRIDSTKSTTITISYTDNGGTSSSFVWDGVGTNRPTKVNSKHPTLSGVFKRTTGLMWFELEIGSSGRVEIDMDISII